MKKEKKAQAQIITTILLILLVLASIVIVWNVFNSLVKEQSEDISITPFTTSVQIEDVKIYLNDSVKVSVKRNPGKGEITKMRFVFYDKQGASEIIDRSEVPEEVELKDYVFAPDEISVKIDKVSVAPFYQDDIGIEAEEMKSKILKNESGDRMVYIYDDLPLSAPGDLISWWGFESDASDSIGGNNGSLLNGAQVINKELVLDGADDYVTINPGIPESNKSFTLSAWIMPAVSVARSGILTKHTSASTSGGAGKQGFFLFYYPDFDRFTFYQYNSTNRLLYSTISSAVENSWHHIAVVRNVRENNAVISIYLNGVNQRTINVNNIIDAESQILTFGKYSYTNIAYFKGSIDDVMIFNKPLESNQIKALYENQKKL